MLVYDIAGIGNDNVFQFVGSKELYVLTTFLKRFYVRFVSFYINGTECPCTWIQSAFCKFLIYVSFYLVGRFSLMSQPDAYRSNVWNILYHLHAFGLFVAEWRNNDEKFIFLSIDIVD